VTGDRAGSALPSSRMIVRWRESTGRPSRSPALAEGIIDPAQRSPMGASACPSRRAARGSRGASPGTDDTGWPSSAGVEVPRAPAMQADLPSERAEGCANCSKPSRLCELRWELFQQECGGSHELRIA